jgi:ATP-dependent DNA ligase
MESFPGALKNGGGGKKKLSRGTTVSRDQSALCGKLTSILRTSRSRRQLRARLHLFQRGGERPVHEVGWASFCRRLHPQDSRTYPRIRLPKQEGLSVAVLVAYLAHMLQRTFPAGFIAPCLPTKTDKLPSGGLWLHEIKHDGFRVIARTGDAMIIDMRDRASRRNSPPVSSARR